MSFNKETSGFENEYEFVDYYNGKRIGELDPISMDLFKEIYKKEFPDNFLIKCFINLNKQKSDIIVIINGIKKYISIKKGYKNSVHTEHIYSFIKYLRSCNMPEDLIGKLLRFQYADGTYNGTGKIRFSSSEYYLSHPDDMKKINVFFNNEDFIRKTVDRLVLSGNNSKKQIDAIIWGTPNDYLWLTKDEIINICLKHKGIAKNSLAIAGLFYQPFNRCLNFNLKYDKYRHYIQFKWYHLSDDIIETMAFYRK